MADPRLRLQQAAKVGHQGPRGSGGARRPRPVSRKQRPRGRGRTQGARGCGDRSCGRRQTRHPRPAAGRARAGVLTAVSSRYTSGYWKDSMARGGRGAAWGRGLRAVGASGPGWPRGEAGALAGAERAAAVAGGSGRGSHERTGGEAARRRGRAGSRKQLPARPGAPPRRAGPAAAAAARGSGRRRACAGSGAQLPLQERRPRPRRPGTRATPPRPRRSHAGPPPGATAPGTRRSRTRAGRAYGAGHTSGHAGPGPPRLLPPALPEVPRCQFSHSRARGRMNSRVCLLIDSPIFLFPGVVGRQRAISPFPSLEIRGHEVA